MTSTEQNVMLHMVRASGVERGMGMGMGGGGGVSVCANLTKGVWIHSPDSKFGFSFKLPKESHPLKRDTPKGTKRMGRPKQPVAHARLPRQTLAERVKQRAGWQIRIIGASFGLLA